MMVTGTMINAVMPQISIAPHPPISSTELPSDPSRKPGFARQMTNPSYQRSVLRSWRSSTIASATFPPPFRQYKAPPRQYRAAGPKVTAARASFNGAEARADGPRRTIGRLAQATDHDQLRLRRDETGRLRRPLALRDLWEVVE